MRLFAAANRSTRAWCIPVSTVVVSYFVLARLFRKHLLATPASLRFEQAVTEIQSKSIESFRTCLYEFELNRFLYALDQRYQLSNTFRLYQPFAPLAQMGSSDLLVLLMGSRSHANRSKLAARTWLRFIEHYFVFSDDEIPGVDNVVLFDTTRGKPTYKDAQHRQLRGAQWILHRHPELIEEAKWFLFADDDTWMNVPALLDTLLKYNENLPLAFGFMWDDGFKRSICWMSGGAGIVLSRRAFRDVAANVYRERCPFVYANDFTLTRCFFALRILKVNMDRLSPVPVQWFNYNNSLVLYPPTYIGKLSYHRMSWVAVVRRLTCDVVAHWNFAGANRDDLAKECSKVPRHSPHMKIEDDVELEFAL